MEIKYIKGDVTTHKDNAILMHICNNKGGWGRGVVLAISKKWKLPEQKYREWHKKGFKLGQVQFVPVGGGITVANMIAQDGFFGVAVKYDHLRTCLQEVAKYAKEKNLPVVGPAIGSGLGGGEWKVIKKIIQEELCDKDIKVTIYEFEKKNC